ncbi:hypothetical protein SAMN04487783_0329 [Agrococcus baldri]|uniref:Uncharacterized protein n=1 Tax=Agrococcus baldri TaxID=153730 RepID=A0AA94HKC5_9MICO|nr:hypothetical protein [Agrococcus baldri]SFR99257.1 hypothetical protein SAMN04487783_0329 [Agrococcus baldri]
MSAVATHLVGSINQPDAESVFRVVADRLDDVPRIPDGEVGERYYWIQFQTLRFDQTPGLERVGEPGYRIRDQFDVRQFTITGDVQLPELGYAAAAIDSYARFAALQEQGVLAAGTRFQVSLPTPIAILGAFIEPGSRAAFEPIYRDALRAELDAILAAIPHERLAIQFDAAVEFAILERDRKPGFIIEPWWDGDALDGVVARLSELASWVPAEVQQGFHLCYGDVEEAHFVQPEDAGTLAAVIRGVLAAAPRQVDWIHLPVPIERDDEAYFAPLAGIEWGRTQPFLGLVHHEDGVDGALRRARAAQTAVPALAAPGAFGIATECGFGRGPAERTAPLLDLHHDVAERLVGELAG